MDSQITSVNTSFKPNRRVMWLWRAKALTRVVIAAVVFALIPFINSIWSVDPAFLKAAYILLGLFIAYEIIVPLLVMSYLRYKAYELGMYQYACAVKHGVLIRRFELIPYRRVQQVQVYQSFYEQLLGLYELHIGTASSVFTFEGLTKEQADQYANQILEAVQYAKEEL